MESGTERNRIYGYEEQEYVDPIPLNRSGRGRASRGSNVSYRGASGSAGRMSETAGRISGSAGRTPSGTVQSSRSAGRTSPARHGPVEKQNPAGLGGSGRSSGAGHDSGYERYVRDNKRSQQRKRRRRHLVWLGLLALVFLAGVGAWYYIDGLAYKVCRVEAGVEVTASDFIKKGDPEAFFTEKSEPFDIFLPGEYDIRVKSGWFTHKSTLYIQDTIPPEGEASYLELELGATCGPEDLVTGVRDATTVSLSFAQEPDFTKAGNQTVGVLLTDLGGNVTRVDAELLIKQVVAELTWEAEAEKPALEDFVIDAEEAEFITDLASVDTTHVGEHEIHIRADGREYTSLLKVVDTVPPVAETKDVSGYALVGRLPEDFVVSIQDVTDVTVSFEQEPDLGAVGTQEVGLLFTDEGANQTRMTARLTLEADTEKPVITGARDIEILVDETISYRQGVTATDNCPEGLSFEIDSSGVDTGKEGTYQAVYVATDLAGNTTSVPVTVTVKPRAYTEEQVNALADAVLADILKEDMTPLEKVEAIYNYNITHIGYIGHSDKGDWTKAAYEGLVEHKGDCYVYACTAKALLTRAGITNMDIAKIPSRTSHYWNLVDIGDGWYHLDTTPRTDHPRIFMWTEEQLMEYSNQHHGSHNYDHSLYPEVN